MGLAIDVIEQQHTLHEPLEDWFDDDGRVVLLGDAVHELIVRYDTQALLSSPCLKYIIAWHITWRRIRHRRRCSFGKPFLAFTV